MLINALILLYLVSLAYIFFYSLGQLSLVLHYRSSKREEKSKAPELTEIKDYPFVTVQLPVFNEKYVVERLIKQVAKLNYPSDRFEVQLLDDSTDETTQIIEKTLQELGRKDVKLIRREKRTGYKAGALDYGLKKSKGEFIAIFDADFMPEPDFLLRTIPQFKEGVGAVQTRWGHLNRDYSLLTRVQAFALDAHFTIEQTGRSHAGSFINFNGTGGVWRKSCIEDAGGWSDDTLTEDLDLSYRAQLKGWKFKYLEDTVAPAEIPVIMQAIKSQQYRWNKGAAETARKNLLNVMNSGLPIVNKVHAFFHLLNSSVFVSLLIAAILSVPVLVFQYQGILSRSLLYLGLVFVIGFLSISLMYWESTKELFGKKAKKIYWQTFPLFLMMSMGLSLHNGLAVLEGLVGRKTSFIRTPKFNITANGDSWSNNQYVKLNISLLTIMEGLLMLYFLAALVFAVWTDTTGLIFFHLMLCIGFGLVFWHSIFPGKDASK